MIYWIRIVFFWSLALAVLAFALWFGITTDNLNPLARFVVVAILVGFSALSLLELKGHSGRVLGRGVSDPWGGLWRRRRR
ncbi:hypothetical protein [Mesorhizobium sp. M0276]|uniref:hypothetical protein n=1 Tax=Mesorhizobium sp. M0276 TaxID=2956928 RepID=UPI003339FFFE